MIDDHRSKNANRNAQIASIYAINELSECITLEHIQKEVQSDTQYIELIDIISDGIPSKRNLAEPAHLRKFWKVRDGQAYYYTKIITQASA